MRKMMLFILLVVVLIGCQYGNNQVDVEWGETAETDVLEITPVSAEIVTEHQRFHIESGFVAVDIVLEVTNTSHESMPITDDFYNLFAVTTSANRWLSVICVTNSALLPTTDRGQRINICSSNVAGNVSGDGDHQCYLMIS